MTFKQTKLKEAYIIEIDRLEDERGYFGRTFCQREFEGFGLNTNIAQANISHNNKRGTLRGLHMQLPPYQESKLIECTRGAIYDVIVDLRENSETFKEWIGVELTAGSHRMLYVPEGFAHGFITLEDDTEVRYLMNQFYTPGFEKGFPWNDPAFDIKWPLEPTIISERDQKHPFFEASEKAPTTLT